MVDCTIYRVRISWSFGVDPDTKMGFGRALRAWEPRCPVCGPLTIPRRAWPGSEPYTPTYKSRKLAKDALYRHRRDVGH